MNPRRTDPTADRGSEKSMEHITMIKSIWGPMERGESYDMQPFFDSLDEDVVFANSLGELHGRQALMHYFTRSNELLESHPFEKPLEYFSNGDRIVILGEETFKVRATGISTSGPWAWVHDIRNGLTTRIVSIQDLSVIADTVAEAFARANSDAAGESGS